MWCVIPAAGRATRMGGVPAGRPKALLEVGGRSLLAWLLARLGSSVGPVCVVTGPGPAARETFRAAAGQLPGRHELRFVVQPEPRGVGDAVLRARGVVEGPFVVVMGDVYYSASLEPPLDAWKRSGAAGGVLVEPGSGTERDPSGWVVTEESRVLDIFKGRGPGSADARLAGLVVLPDSLFELETPAPSGATGEIEIEQLVRALLREEVEFRAVPYEGRRQNVNRPEDLERIRMWMTGRDTGGEAPLRGSHH